MLERTLSEDMTTLSAYFQTWPLKLSHAKTMIEKLRELKVKNNDKILPFCPVPTYLGVKLDRTLAYRNHLEALRKNYQCAFRC